MPIINTYTWEISLRNVIYLILQAKNLVILVIPITAPAPHPDFCIHISIYLLSIVG